MSKKMILEVVLEELGKLVENINISAKTGEPLDIGTGSVCLVMLLTLLNKSRFGEEKNAVLQKLGELHEKCEADWVAHDIGFTMDYIRDN